jgi:hypothetical protein
VNCVRVMAADILNVFRRLARPFIIWLAIVAAPAYVVLYPRKDWWIFPSAFFLVFALYWLRAKVRLYFGLVEFLFGAYVFVIHNQSKDFSGPAADRTEVADPPNPCRSPAEIISDRGRRLRRGARNCLPYCRTIAAAGSSRMPTPPPSST